MYSMRRPRRAIPMATRKQPEIRVAIKSPHPRTAGPPGRGSPRRRRWAPRWRKGAAGHGDHDTGDDGGVEPVLGRHPTGDGQCHGKGMAMMPTVMPAMRSRPKRATL